MNDEKIASLDYDLCLEDCDYLEDKSVWIATLSNGITVYQDDNKSGRERVAWKRLAKYCHENNVDVIGLCLKFRSNVIVVKTPDKIDGFYFAYGAQREFDEDITRAYYVTGYSKDNSIFYTWYTIPELIKDKEGSRKITDRDTEDLRLILNTNLRP
tara:strand:+ start:2091 stop:2558 length:468 start_codon:yes stop_codon:yes gene_type:complete